MNHHQRHLPPGGNRALRYLSLLLLALTFQSEAEAMPRLLKPKSNTLAASSRGYLTAVGAPALRFEEPARVLTFHPVPTVTAPAPSRISATSPQPEIQDPVPTAALSPADEPGVAEVTTEKKTVLKNKPVPTIIPDDTRRPIHAEDFLPFFQFPAAGTSNGTLNVIVPVPREPAPAAALPASSATYTQTPK